MSFQTNLTSAELERIAICTEEIGEALEVVGVIGYQGLDEKFPNSDKQTRDLLQLEMAHVLYSIDIMSEKGDIDWSRMSSDPRSEEFKKRFSFKSFRFDEMQIFNYFVFYAGTALQALGKIGRHGYESYHPYSGSNNRKEFEVCIFRLWWLIEMMTFMDLMDSGELVKLRIKKRQDAPKWQHFQGE